MKRRWLPLLLAALALALRWLGVNEAPGTNAPWRAPVTRVLDGDTVELANTRVRLYGIDAPEKDQPFGPQATACLAALIWGRVVEVHPKDTDRYGRLVAILLVEGQEVNAQMVEQGCAWAYPPTGQAYEDEEARARQARRGLWAQSAPIPPWEWRR